MPLIWTAHPAKHRPRELALAVGVMLLTLAGVMTAFGSLFLVALAAVILVVSIAAFLFPTTYTLSEDGVEERRFATRKQRRWRDLRRVQVGPGAALVSPFARPRWLDRYRGIIIMFDGGDRDAIVRLLRDKIDASKDSVMPARTREGEQLAEGAHD